ncbi:L-seryl-tRNA(Sec) selenium transferase [Ktedonobacter racemifer]|uniref:L-seryl-tRNA(Sec) selenium transferase n=1 Tax=Ktedonobacter racemifer DSM 44963 TaxID=485913 RepID=D6TRF0_KTERA|nr:L-seryl-tRNA(Sec) selenium transferase [Ktedonobacter racemifer]EFH87849.1 L-seryl-tRNA selenium transferase [Ktedonobacter racemifer DSM 44963]
MSLYQSQLRLLPSVDELLHTQSGQDLVARYSHPLAVQAIRESITLARQSILRGEDCPSNSTLLVQATHHLQERELPHLRPLINATGVIINTNLGRAPMSAASLEAVRQVASGYSNLEYDLAAGERGSRHSHVSQLLSEITGAEAALVTNNNAAAVLLGLSALAQSCEVIISRGQLVEIGGGFRVPDVMRQSGCQLVEVGTTNRTRITDYERAISGETALLLSVHPSNFLISGFTEATPEHELVSLAHEHKLLVMHDLGSGCLLPSERYGLAHEPTPQESIKAGVDLVCFSGDKLLGGPQAGILVGKASVMQRLAKHPLMRAVRIDKMTLAALEATLQHYQRDEAERHIPIWRMIAARPEQLGVRVDRWIEQLKAQGINARRQAGQSTVGGGSLPTETLPTVLLTLEQHHCARPLEEIASDLRAQRLPVIARISRDTLLFDPRTVLEEQDQALVQAITQNASPVR